MYTRVRLIFDIWATRKLPVLSDRKSLHISNIGRLTIAQPRCFGVAEMLKSKRTLVYSKVLFVLFAFIFFNGEALECAEGKKPTVCLNMIVKNESKVIERCLASVKPFIDYWVIVDTGSTDGTQAIIRNFMKDIPGQLQERPWVNFGHNRNEALELAKPKADYIFLIDADEYLEWDDNFSLAKLEHNVYCIKCYYDGMSFGRFHIVKSSPDVHWEGVLHEYLDVPNTKAIAILTGIRNITTSEGARSRDPAKLVRDAMLLEAEVEKNPENERLRFYLAQSYRCHGYKDLALQHYRKRVELGGYEQEVFDSLLNIAQLERQLGGSDTLYRDSLLKAFRYRPARAEPLYYLSNLYRNQGDHQLAYLFSRLGLSAPPTQDLVNVQEWVNHYGLLFEYSIASYHVGEYSQSLSACNDLLKMTYLPENYRQQTEMYKNLVLAKIEPNSGV